MVEIKVCKEQDKYICETGLSVSQWLSILQDTSLVNEDRLDMLRKFYDEPEHKSTCSALAEKYDEGSASAIKRYVALNTQLGIAICKRFGIEFKRENDESTCYWIVAMTGRELNDGLFEWELRPEVVEAMEKTDSLLLLVSDANQVRKNLETLEYYLSSDTHRDFAIDRIHRGSNFLVYNVGTDLHFAPSRFSGYVNNSRKKYESGLKGNGTVTDLRYSSAFGWEKKQDEDLDNMLVSYCSSLGTTSTDKTHRFFQTGIQLKKRAMDEFERIKKILEFFVAYLEYCHHNPKSDPKRNTSTKGFFEYIQPLLPNKLSRQGQGWKNHSIQDPIRPWEQFYDYEIKITADARSGYTSIVNYLNWNDTSYNIIAKWEDGEIIALTQVEQVIQDDGRVSKTLSLYKDALLSSLGLFDGKYPNEALKLFYINFYKGFDDDLYNKLLSQMKAEKYIKILEKNHNIILTGAPGTGKTYLAKTIAHAMDAKFQMVQFHPSYDYTDFIEGLRPTPPDSNGNIGFARTEGVFWKFCESALKSKVVNGVDNFEEAWESLITKINDDDFVEIPNLSSKGSFRVELNEYGTVLATRTYENDEHDKGKWIKGKSKFFNKEQLYNVYRGQKGIPSGGHDNYRRAVVEEMKNSFSLKEFKKGTSTDNPTKYVFIVDEINRGELSKIFGELFFSIDPGYRGIEGAVKTQYANMHEKDNAFDEVLHSLPSSDNYPGSGWFFVPDNVYIIGTMNDIDRSVETMDFALRRRFRWCEILADEMQEQMGLTEEAKKRMANLNDTIVSEEVGLSRSYCIGASYFIGIKTNEDFEELWSLRLSGLLFEYFRGMDDADYKMELLERAYNNVNE